MGRVKSPVAGKIIAANDELEWDTGLVNSDPYGEGWLLLVRPADPAEIEALLDAEAYAAKVQGH